MKSIQIGGENFKIVYKEMEDFGFLNFDKREITIKKGMCPEETRRTIFHESIHATLAMAGMDHLIDDPCKEEAIVRSLDNIFYPTAKKIFES